jgi:hypothetical protein
LFQPLKGVDGRLKAGQDEIERAVSFPSTPRDFPGQPPRSRGEGRGEGPTGIRGELISAVFEPRHRCFPLFLLFLQEIISQRPSFTAGILDCWPRRRRRNSGITAK